MGALGEHWLSVNGLVPGWRAMFGGRGGKVHRLRAPLAGSSDGSFCGVGGLDGLDCAAFLVGRALAIFPASAKFLQVKGMFWTENPLGDALHEVLGVVE